MRTYLSHCGRRAKALAADGAGAASASPIADDRSIGGAAAIAGAARAAADATAGMRHERVSNPPQSGQSGCQSGLRPPHRAQI